MCDEENVVSSTTDPDGCYPHPGPSHTFGTRLRNIDEDNSIHVSSATDNSGLEDLANSSGKLAKLSALLIYDKLRI